MTIEQLYQLYIQHPSVETDSRKLKKGDIFFALKGPSFNGNAFAQKALEAGAAYAVVDEGAVAVNEKIILVDDVLTTLQALAKYHREQFNIPFIAITGSNGKTTTKELVHAVLATTYTTYTTEGNLNNHIGVPLTLLKIKKDAAMAVIEMGANHQQEIAGYCNYTKPTHGIITNAGKAHLEGFGGEEGVKKGKGELYDYLRKNNGTAFIMRDYDYLQQMSQGIQHIFTYGTSDADITGEAVKTGSSFLQVQFTKGLHESIQSQLVGDYNLPNVLCAAAAGVYFKVPPDKIKIALENYAPSNSRSQLLQKNGNTIILDAYNANPSSMKAAIENFARMPADDKILMLGGMAELGNESIEEHKKIIGLINQYSWKEVALTGGDFMKIDHPYIRFENALEAANWFRQQGFQQATILIKGSRSMQMEKLIE
jgi:UDP-N-acetylmuramoyl-tripeptide--D-alanyl-D-alanine ligase